MIHARKTVTVTAEDDQFQIFDGGDMISAVPRTSIREVHRFKAYAAKARPLSGPGSNGQETRHR